LNLSGGQRSRLLGRTEIAEGNLDLGEFLAKRGQAGRQERRRHGAGVADRQSTASSIRRFAYGGGELLGRHQHLPRMLQQHGSRMRQAYASRVAVEQAGAEIVFQIADLLAEGRLRHA